MLPEQTNNNPEMVFTAGLLHDIGQLLMFTASPANYVLALDQRRQHGFSLVAAERQVFGYDHAIAGRELARVWKLPGEIGEAIAAHHEPDDVGSEIGNLAHVSEVLSHALDLGELLGNRVPEVSELAIAQLSLPWSHIAAHFAEIEARYDGIRIALGI